MPANVGAMFYTGDMPWHEEGLALQRPATLDEALKVGELNWEVGEADLMTAGSIPSPAPTRKAIVRLDRPEGHERRVVGVVHRGFQPIQNRDGAMLFDGVFGKGEAVYETGGYLGDGEVIWLLARIEKPLTVGRGDVVQPYALLANSHDGSIAFTIRLTTVRVVCQNTLAIAMSERGLGQAFRRRHGGSFREHAEAAREFYAATLHSLGSVTDQFVSLSKKRCEKAQFEALLASLLPEPRKPRNAAANRGLLRAWETKVENIRRARAKIVELRESGRGMNLDTAAGTYWGALNAIIEFVDHHHGDERSRLSYALLGDGMDLKMRAFAKIGELAKAA
ncbi:MAG TPA: DUF932 domain-containing protein [Stellaceae bacterium]|nr:DUF932 domain-containing protein [Stellaceae bacterium]